MNRTNITFCPLASGSSGNCAFFSSPETNILIDAGLSGIRIETALEAINVNPKSLNAVFITHEHSDHIGGAGVLARRYGVEIYATPGTWESMDRGGQLGKLKKEQRKTVYPGEYIDLRDITVRPFAISHDSAQPVGYNIFYDDIKTTVATDLGEVCSEIEENIKNSRILLLEANHDIDMLNHGPYPYQLKRRILGKRGHLSNVACGTTLAGLADSLHHVYLGHLSEENNTPALAYETVKNILEVLNIPVNAGMIGLQLYMANRSSASRPCRLNTSK
ncbi:MAG: MBL fold metallo-hydrolase [Defluviitaleaceae bacterium]|nr:MBL fold metallo-hydrolase [Defluviitaleaceae bacterium]